MENLNQTYYLKAYSFTLQWVKIQFKPFTSEYLKLAMFDVIGKPHEPRSIGGIFRELNKLGLIKKHGFGVYKAKEGHGKPTTIWISKEYSISQQKKRLSKDQLNLFTQ